jgi:hypothetical protein
LAFINPNQLRQHPLFLVSQTNESEGETKVVLMVDDFSLEWHPTPCRQLDLKANLFTNGHLPNRIDVTSAQTNVGGTRAMFT